MTAPPCAAAMLFLTVLNLVAVTGLFILIRRQRIHAAIALNDVRHEFEVGLAYLDNRLRARRDPTRKLPPIDDEGT